MKTLYALAISLLTALTVAAPSSTASGAKLYAAHCQSCHGAGATGVRGLGPALHEASGWKFELFKKAVLSGTGDNGKPMSTVMPRFAQAKFAGQTPTDIQLRELQGYLQTLK